MHYAYIFFHILLTYSNDLFLNPCLYPEFLFVFILLKQLTSGAWWDCFHPPQSHVSMLDLHPFTALAGGNPIKKAVMKIHRCTNGGCERLIMMISTEMLWGLVPDSSREMKLWKSWAAFFFKQSWLRWTWPLVSAGGGCATSSADIADAGCHFDLGSGCNVSEEYLMEREGVTQREN